MKKWNNSKHGDSSFFGTKISLIHFSAAEVNLEAVKVSEAFESGKWEEEEKPRFIGRKNQSREGTLLNRSFSACFMRSSQSPPYFEKKT